MARSHDLADGFSLLETPGWQTLLAILSESGERPSKRSSSLLHDFNGDYDYGHEDQLAKRFKGTSLN